MWESFLPEADAALEAAGVEPLITLLRQIEADAALPKAVRDEAAAALQGYMSGRRSSARKAKAVRP